MRSCVNTCVRRDVNLTRLTPDWPRVVAYLLARWAQLDSYKICKTKKAVRLRQRRNSRSMFARSRLYLLAGKIKIEARLCERQSAKAARLGLARHLVRFVYTL